MSMASLLRLRSSSLPSRSHFLREEGRRSFFSSSRPLWQSEAAVAAAAAAATAVDKKRIAQEYNLRRASYKKAVSALRKQYAYEITEQKKLDDSIRRQKREEVTRQKLQRNRLKKIRSAQNALRQEEERLQRQREFELHLQQQQLKRDEKNARFQKARQLLLQELEEESKLWLTTPEEVEEAFATVDAEQSLWTYPGGVIGTPHPTLDSDYWKYECHTWDMSKNLILPRDLLLQDLLDLSYEEANVDSSYWNTNNRKAVHEAKVEKARLRALIKEEGRRSLLLKQRELLQQQSTPTTSGSKDDLDIPKPIPAPKLDILANYKEMEKEGVKLLQNDPTKFFVFEEQHEEENKMTGTDNSQDASHHDHHDETSHSGKSATLGKPIRVRDPVRDSNPLGHTPYPMIVGKLPKPDTRTEREKKRDEREERMLAAAIQGGGGGGKEGQQQQQIMGMDAVDFAASDTIVAATDPIVYEDVAEMDSDDEWWEDGLDPDLDKDKLDVPRERRYKEEDVDWVLEKLSEKVKKLEEQLAMELDNARQEAQSRSAEADVEQQQQQQKEQEEMTTDASKMFSSGSIQRSEGVDERGSSYVQYDFTDELGLGALGVDTDELSRVFGSLTKEQMEAMKALEEELGRDLELESTNTTMSSEKIAETLKMKVPGLSEKQMQELVDIELSLAKNEYVKEMFRLTKDDDK